VLDVLRDGLAKLDVPILGGLPIGHGLNPATIPLGTVATIDPSAGTLTVAPGVR
jgi:muramoyltetrapeptide carboxypeptidase